MSFLDGLLAIGGAAISNNGGDEAEKGWKGGWTHETTDADKFSSVLNDLIENLSSRQSGTVQKGGKFSREQGKAFISSLPDYIKQFSKENAIADSSGAVTAALSEVLATNLPDIRTADTIAGGYNNTSTRLLQDNVFAQAAAAGARVRMDAIDKYAGIQQGAQQTLTQLLSLAQDADVTTTAAEDQVSSSKSSQIENTSAVSGVFTEYDELSAGNVATGGSNAGAIKTGLDIFSTLSAE